MVVALCALASATSAGSARADINPTRHVLAQEIYVPQAFVTSDHVTARLYAAVNQFKQAEHRIGVAVIGSPADLGSAARFFGRPAAYASFLGRRIERSRHRREPLLVVMPNGLGEFRLGMRERAALRGFVVPPGAGSDALTEAGIAAVVKLAAAVGVRLRIAPARSAVDSSSPAAARKGQGAVWPFLLPVAFVLAALAVAQTRARLRRRATAQRS